MVSQIAAILGLVFFIIGLIFLPLKIFRKDLENPTYRILYKVHVQAPKLATILALVHGFTMAPINPNQQLSGWVLGISMILMLLMGAFLTIKTKTTPLDDQGDATYH